MSETAAETTAWPPWTAPVALLLALAIGLVLGGIVFAFGAIVTGDTDGTLGVRIASIAASDLGFIASALFFAQLAGRRPRPEDFGLRPTRFWPAVGWVALAYLALIILGGLWLSLFDLPARDPTIDDLTKGTAAIVATAVLVTIIAPVAEEFLFRGYIFTALRGWAGVWGAAVIDGLLFGAIHLDPDRPVAFLVPLAFFGMLLCLVYWKTRSLYPCIALHAINNALAFGNSESWEAWQIALLALGALVTLALVFASLRLLVRRPTPLPA